MFLPTKSIVKAHLVRQHQPKDEKESRDPISVYFGGKRQQLKPKQIHIYNYTIRSNKLVM
jgi:hypothetical protein